MGAPLKSSLYECEIVHCRIKPKRNEFRYRLFFFDLYLDELPSLTKRLWLFSHNRFNLYGFKDQDHLDVGEPDLRSNLLAWLGEQGIDLSPDVRIRLISLPRILGYIFNPVSFFFIYDRDSRPLHAVVEVCNTFRELKPWLIKDEETPGFFHITVPKHFYVSPFSSLTTEFDFRVRVPEEDIEIHIDDLENGERTLLSWIRGKRQPLTNGRLAWYVIRYPLLTLQVIFKIHWQAMLLWMRGFSFVRKSEGPEHQRDLYRPHHSPSSKDPS